MLEQLYFSSVLLGTNTPSKCDGIDFERWMIRGLQFIDLASKCQFQKDIMTESHICVRLTVIRNKVIYGKYNMKLAHSQLLVRVLLSDALTYRTR